MPRQGYALYQNLVEAVEKEASLVDPYEWLSEKINAVRSVVTGKWFLLYTKV